MEPARRHASFPLGVGSTWENEVARGAGIARCSPSGRRCWRGQARRGGGPGWVRTVAAASRRGPGRPAGRQRGRSPSAVAPGASRCGRGAEVAGGAAQAEGQGGGRQPDTSAAPHRGGRLARSPWGGPKRSPAPEATGAELATAVGARARPARPRWWRGSPLRGRTGAEGNFTGRVSTATTGASEGGARTSSADGPWRRQPPGSGRPTGRRRSRRGWSVLPRWRHFRRRPEQRNHLPGAGGRGASDRRERSLGGAERRSGGRRRRPQPEHGDTLASGWAWGPPGECVLRQKRGDRQVLVGAAGGGPWRPAAAGGRTADRP